MVAATNPPAVGPLNVETLSSQLLNRAVGKPVLQVDEALNDSDKTFTVPANTTWEILSLWAELTTTATVGNRQVALEIQDAAGDIIAQVRHGVTQAASLTRNYLFAPDVADLTAFRDADYLSSAMPRLILPESSIIRVFDKAAVDAAADDLVLQMMVVERVEI
ncbi:MAG: hypothetical protein ACE5HV_00170 [Acidobacteriota bacterium]